MMNNPVLVNGCVMTNRSIAAEQFLLSLKLPASFPAPLPGQFVMVKAPSCQTPLLARPFSIYAFTGTKEHATMEIMYSIVGRGTRLLSSLLPGSLLRVMGPLGNGFTIVPERKNIVLLAGGMGIAPLTFLAAYYVALLGQKEVKKGYLNRRIIFYVGAKTGEVLPGIERIENFSEDIKISTDDGSWGFQGTVTQLLSKDLAFYSPEDAALFACGPAPMLKNLAAMLSGKDFFCQVSMEEKMACGLGACLGCALSLKERSGDNPVYKRVCKDGPVFNIQDVSWELSY